MGSVFRVVVALNLAFFVTLSVTTGSPIPLSNASWISSVLGDWWLLSTAGIVFMFLRLLFKKISRREPSPWFWLDITLFVAWIFAFVLIMLVAIAGFSGF
jgi:hypothetical protein